MLTSRFHLAAGAAVLLAVTAGPLVAQGEMRAAPSGRGTTEVTLMFADSAARAAAGPAKIRIDYGQPHLRGRALGTDSLVPYGQPWRTGANDATMLTTEVDLTIGGFPVPKGSYVLQTLPTRDGWTLLVQRQVQASGMAAAMTYDPANDVARVPLRVSTSPAPLESLSFWLIPATQPGQARGELRLGWGTVALATDWAVR